MIGARSDEVTSSVAEAFGSIAEKKRICKACAMNNGQCKQKEKFQKDFMSRSCPSFKLRKEGFW